MGNPKKEDAMKAVVYTKYGPPDVLELREVAKPVPKNNEVLIKPYAEGYKLNPMGFAMLKEVSLMGS